MELAVSALLGYLLGSLSPAALLGRLKKQNLRELGTKNLGATNTTLVLGKGFGALVMLFDMAKAILASRLAKKLFPAIALASLLAGAAAVVGHIFPFYLHFQGGKGLASFGGMVLAHDPFVFLILLVLGVFLMLVINYSVALPFSAAVLFPIFVGLRSRDPGATVIALAVSGLVFAKHFPNLLRICRGEDYKVRDFIKKHLFSKS